MRSAIDGFSPADVIEAIESSCPRSALFTTYTFSPSVFNELYLRPLQRCGCERIVVLVDSLGFSQSLDELAAVEGIGTDYILRQVPCEGSFHAKIVLIESPAQVILGVGSGNLTISGLQSNAEVGALLKTDETSVADSMLGLGRSLLSLANFDTMGDKCDEFDFDANLKVITSLKSPILQQLDIPQEIDRIDITSPFVDNSGKVIPWLKKRWPQAEIHIRIDPRYYSLSHQMLNNAFRDVYFSVPITKDTTESNAPAVHGKIIKWTVGDSSYMVLGSANMTVPGLLSTDNVEAVLFRKLHSSVAQRTYRNRSLQWRKAGKRDVLTAPPASPTTADGYLVAVLSQGNLRIYWPANLVKEGLLKLQQAHKVVLNFDIKAETTERGQHLATLRLSKEQACRFNDSPSLASLILQDGKVLQGWLEMQDILETSAEARYKLRLINDLSAEPDSKDENALVEFLHWLRMNLDSGTKYLKHKNMPNASVDDHALKNEDVQIERRLLIESLGKPIRKDSKYETAIEKAFDLATSRAQFFDEEYRVVEKTQSTKSLNEVPAPKSIRKSLSPKVTRVLDDLLSQYCASMEAVDSIELLAVRLRQLPTCLKALRYCSSRWQVSLSHCSRHLLEVLLVYLGPGYNSSVRRSGVLHRLVVTHDSHLHEFYGVRNGLLYLNAILLALVANKELTRMDVCKDMYDMLSKVLDKSAVHESMGINAEIWEIACGKGTPIPDYSLVINQINKENGELGNLKTKRAALHASLDAINSKTFEEADLIRYASDASSSPQIAQHIHGIFQKIANSQSKSKIEDVDLDHMACPACNMTISDSEISKLADPTYVHLHRCGTLLVRAIV